MDNKKFINLVESKLITMKTESLKLDLIERLMKVKEEATLLRMERLITQAEMESRAKESLRAIAQGEVVTIDEFQKGNEEWVKENLTK